MSIILKFTHMSRLFLASSFDKTVDIFIDRFQITDPSHYSVCFIDIAAEPYKATYDLFWVKQDYDAFTSRGFVVDCVDLRRYRGDFSEFRIVHFCGGHTRYLLSQVHKLGVFDPIKSLVQANKLIYTGTSAGSMIVAPNLFGVGRLDDETGEIFSIEDQIGFDLVDFLILPHFQNPDFVSTNYESIKSTDFPHPLIFLNDDQAIVAIDKKYEIVDLTRDK